MLTPETKSRINACRDILVGKIPDPKGQVDQITNALVYKFMDDQDRRSCELGGKATFFVWEYAKYAWSKLFDSKLTNQEKAILYTEGLDRLSRAGHLPDLFKQIFKDAYLPFRDANTIVLFLAVINGFDYHHSEELGNAFEYLLSIMGSQGDAGQFRTPRHIIEFLVDVVDPQKNETIYDPACGTAGFLIEAFNHIKGKEKLSPSETKKLFENVSGVDIDPGMAKIARVNLYLHGFKSPAIHENDTLTNEALWEDKYDVILANPPFMSPKGGIRPHKKFAVQANRAEVLFTDYIAEHIKLRGRAGIIIPEGIIFQSSNAYKDLRKMLVEGEYLWAVVSLPSGVFNPYSGVKTSILFLDRERAKKTDKILFVKVSADGFDLGAQRRPTTKNDLPKILELIESYKSGNLEALDESELAFLIEKKKIAESGDWNLSGELYRTKKVLKNTKWPMMELGEVCDFQNGYAFQSEKYTDDGYQVIRITNVQKGFIDPKDPKFYPANEVSRLKEFILDDGDLLMSLTGNVGRVWILKQEHLPAVLNQRVAKLKIKNSEHVFVRYLFHMLNSNKFEFDAISLSSWVAQKNLWTGALKDYKIPLPPLEIQREIVAEIEGYQKIIDGARQVVENYKPTFKIDPTWEMVNLGDENIFKIESGGTPRSTEESYWNGDIQWATLADMPADDFITEIKKTERTISKDGLANSSAKVLPIGTVIVSTRATIGRVAIARVPMATNQGSKNIIIQDISRAMSEFIALIMKYLAPKMETMATGGTFKEISKSTISKIEIPLPPLEVQKQIVAQIESEQKLVDATKELISIYEAKIKEKIQEIWNTNL